MRSVSDLMDNYAAVVYTYKTIGTDKLASHYLGEHEILELAKYFSGEMAVLQTCNRIEIYLYSDDRPKLDTFLDYLNSVHGRDISTDATILRGVDLVRHIFEVAAGIDSLSVGEYEILSQIKEAMMSSIKLGIGSRHMRILLERALKVGRRVRIETSISRGKVGVYSLGVEFAKGKVPDLKNKMIAIVGAGEVAEKLALILYNEGIRNVTIFNRTFERGRKLAIKYGFSYFPLDFKRLEHYDVIFSAIFYPEKIRAPQKSLVIDLGSPQVFEGDNVYSLRDLESISLQQLEERQREITKARSIVEEGITEFERDLSNLIYDELVSSFSSRFEEIRKAEVERALKVLKKENDPKVKEVLDAMTRSILKKMLSPVFENLKGALERNETNYINFTIRLFNHGGIPENEAEEAKAKQDHKGYSGGDSAEGH